VIFDPFTLSLSLCHEPDFVPFNSLIRLVFDLKNPLAANGFFMRRKINQGPSLISLKSSKFSLHSIEDMQLLDAGTEPESILSRGQGIFEPKKKILNKSNYRKIRVS
jgi:hypothetical protein